MRFADRIANDTFPVIEGIRTDTLYVATGGGIGPETLSSIEDLLSDLVVYQGALLASAADARKAGERYATTRRSPRPQASPSNGLPSTAGIDWNDVLERASHVPSLIVAIGDVIERHMIDTRFLARPDSQEGWGISTDDRERASRSALSQIAANQPSSRKPGELWGAKCS